MAQRRYGRPKGVTVNLHGVEGRGPTKTEAKADAAARIERALTGSYTPLLISAHGKSALVFRTPEGWVYALLDSYLSGGSHSIFGITCNTADTSAAAEQHARFHLAQTIFTIGGPTGLDVIESDQDRDEHVRWCMFQYCYQMWKNAHPEFPDHQIHRLAREGKWPEGIIPWSPEVHEDWVEHYQSELQEEDL